MSEHYDKLETRDQMTRSLSLQMDLPRQIAYAKAQSTAYSELLADVDASAVNSMDALAALPVTRKSDLVERQGAQKPFGGFQAGEVGKLRRVYSSPGPIYEPEGDSADYWRMARAIYAAGVRAGDLVHNTFSYHFLKLVQFKST